MKLHKIIVYAFVAISLLGCQHKEKKNELSKEDLSFYAGIKEAADILEEPQIVEETGNTEDVYITFNHVELKLKENEALSKELYYENIKEYEGKLMLTVDRQVLYPKGRYDIHYGVCRDESCEDAKIYRVQLLVE